MKKLTLILLLIPILNNGQLLSDLCNVDSIDQFKRAATESNYEKVVENDEYISYALKPIGKEDPETMKSVALAMYLPKEDVLSWFFDMSEVLQKINYEQIYKAVKRCCNYLKITNVEGTDYATYEVTCGRGKEQFGFAIEDGIGKIIRF